MHKVKSLLNYTIITTFYIFLASIIFTSLAKITWANDIHTANYDPGIGLAYKYIDTENQ